MKRIGLVIAIVVQFFFLLGESYSSGNDLYKTQIKNSVIMPSGFYHFSKSSEGLIDSLKFRTDRTNDSYKVFKVWFE